jgi:23S rRNA pseudouridine955/2504/2580 synthase
MTKRAMAGSLPAPAAPADGYHAAVTGNVRRLSIGPDDAGQRVDRFLRKYLPGATLSLVFKLLRTRQVEVNGARARPDARLAPGDEVAMYMGEHRLGELRPEGTGARRREAPEAPPLRILHRDAHVLAVSKPARLLVHEGEAGDEPTLLDAVRREFPGSGAHTFRPALAHRLDRDTSGVVLVGLSAEGLRGLEEALRRRRVEKVYLALVLGIPREREGEVDAPILKPGFVTGDTPRVRAGHPDGEPATTAWRVLAEGDGCALVEARPRTGRTHQIRAHLALLGHPVLGDPAYGDRAANEAWRSRRGLWRHFLHALRVELEHPVTGKPLRVEAPIPAELVRVLRASGIRADAFPAEREGEEPAPRNPPRPPRRGPPFRGRGGGGARGRPPGRGPRGPRRARGGPTSP